MKTTLKILGLVFIIAVTMPSCEDSVPQPEYPDFTLDDFYKLHHHIRPTKPIRIPDTMAIKMRTTILENPSDTTTTPQDSIPQENEK
jgi:hypothetical protein